MTQYLINEGVLNDDTLYIADNAFKGNYKAILEYYTFATTWSDTRHVRRFRTLDTARAFIAKRYPNYDLSEIA